MFVTLKKLSFNNSDGANGDFYPWNLGPQSSGKKTLHLAEKLLVFLYSTYSFLSLLTN